MLYVACSVTPCRVRPYERRKCGQLWRCFLGEQSLFSFAHTKVRIVCLAVKGKKKDAREGTSLFSLTGLRALEFSLRCRLLFTRRQFRVSCFSLDSNLIVSEPLRFQNFLFAIPLGFSLVQRQRWNSIL